MVRYTGWKFHILLLQMSNYIDRSLNVLIRTKSIRRCSIIQGFVTKFAPKVKVWTANRFFYPIFLRQKCTYIAA